PSNAFFKLASLTFSFFLLRTVIFSKVFPTSFFERFFLKTWRSGSSGIRIFILISVEQRFSYCINETFVFELFHLPVILHLLNDTYVLIVQDNFKLNTLPIDTSLLNRHGFNPIGCSLVIKFKKNGIGFKACY